MRPYIHPRTPPKLRAAFRAAKNLRGEGYKYHILAEQIGVNVGHLHKLIRRGIEPTDKTEKGQAARAAMFLPRHKRKTRVVKKDKKRLPAFLYWWTRGISKEMRNDIIRQAWKKGQAAWNTNNATPKTASLKSRAKPRTSKKPSTNG